MQNPHIQAYTFKTFMCNAANVIFTLLKLVYNSFYFTATYTLMVSRHYFTFSTLAPIYRMVNTCIDLVYNAAPMQLLKYIPVCTVPSFFNFGFVTITIGIIRFIARDRLVRKLTYRAQ